MEVTLIADEIDEPHAIALDPIRGIMYWSDCGQLPHIERAGMDGLKRQILIDKEIVRPIALTLDFTLDRIYWLDSELLKISSSQFDGNDCRQIFKSAEFLSQPFSLSIFEDSVYWTNEEKEAVFMANKFNGSDVKILIEMNTV